MNRNRKIPVVQDPLKVVARKTCCTIFFQKPALAHNYRRNLNCTPRNLDLGKSLLNLHILKGN